jgi:PAS domain S-box-containing protein
MGTIKRGPPQGSLHAAELAAAGSIARSPHPLYVVDERSGRFVEVNPAALRQYGYTRAEFLALPPEGLRAAGEAAPAATDDPAPPIERREERHRRRDGTPIDVELTAMRLVRAGRPVRVVLALDVSGRRQAERGTRRLAGRLAMLRGLDRAILAAQGPKAVARAALRHLARLLPCWHARILLLDAPTHTAEVLATRGRVVLGVPRGPFDLDRCGDLGLLRAGGAELVADVSRLPAPPACVAELTATGMRAYARLPLIDARALVGVLGIFSDRVGGIGPEHLEVARELVAPLAIAIRHARLFAELSNGRARLEVLSRRLLRAQEDERRAIARELHDQIGQGLTAARVSLSIVAGGPLRAEARRHVAESAALIEALLAQVRDLSLALRPALLDDLGLDAALEALARNLARSTGLEIACAIEPEPDRLEADVATTCYRAAQEALTNIVRHAGARRARLVLRHLGDHLELIVSDDGRGFDVTDALRRAAEGGSLGILGMRERVTLLGGTLTIRAAPGRGTEVRAVVPWRAAMLEGDEGRGR